MRSIRLAQDVEKTLVREAEKTSSSVNSLVNLILSKYSEWGRFDGKVHNVSFSSSLLKLLFDGAPERLLERLSVVEAERFEALTKFILGSFEFKNLLTMFGRMGQNSRTWSLEQRLQGGHLILLLYHDLGKGYSQYLAKSVKRTLERLGRVGDEIGFEGHVVRVKISLSRDLNRDENDSVPFAKAELRDW